MKSKAQWMFAFLIGLLALSTAACIVAGPPAQPSPAYQTPQVTRIVTQIVIPAPTYTQPPTPTKTPYPTPTLEWDPFSAPIYFPNVGCAASRLQLGGMAFVALTDANTRLYYDKEPFEDPGIRKLDYGEKMQIIDGPWCFERNLVWKVYMVADKRVGHVIEGDGKVYWILPLSPAEPTPNRDD